MYDYYDYYDYGYGYSRIAELSGVFAVVAAIIAITVMILSFIFIIPAKKRDRLPGFFKVIHDIFNFNGLVIEVILKAAYIISTVFIILYSFLMIFTGENVLGFFLSMILGPIAIRIAYELIMMVILLVKNVISINCKLKFPDDKKNKEADAFGFDYTKYINPQNINTMNPSYMQNTSTHNDPVQTPATMQNPVSYNEPIQEPASAAPVQNTAEETVNARKFCPNCGNELSGSEAFCGKCGFCIEQ